MSKKKISKAQIKRNRKAWVEALRSGKFKQTRGKLRSRNAAYCCLGVVCELAEMPKVYRGQEYVYGDAEVLAIDPADLGWNDDTPDRFWERFSPTGLPLAGQEWLGVSSDSPRLAEPVVVKVYDDGTESTEASLIELNDTYEWTFAQIADAVEKYGLAK